MISWASFPRTLVFAVVAAAGWVAWVLVTMPILGLHASRALYLALVLGFYVGGLAPRGRLRAALLAAAGAIVTFAIAGTTPDLGLGFAVVLGVARGGFLHRSAPARALMVEGLLLAVGLLAARAAPGPAPLTTAVALWSFFLVQSTFFLRRAERGGAPRPSGDPFDEACRRAAAVLERGGG